MSFSKQRRWREVAKRAAIARLIDRMAKVAGDRMVAIGFCTDDQFRAVGFTARNVKEHGNLARHRAVQAAVKARESVGAPNDRAAG